MFAALLAVASCFLVEPHEERSFLSWMRTTNQLFTGDEYNLRLGIWLANLRAVQAHNAAGHSFKLTMNKFAALTPAEYRSLLGLRKTVAIARGTRRTSKSNAESLDWRDKGAVTDVKDQGGCGSCWAFSTICSIEGTWAAKKGELVSMSESNLVDCDTYDEGCNGGFMFMALEYIVNFQNGKVMTEADYPYKASARKCAYDDSKALWRVARYVNVTAGSEDDLQSKVEDYGPVAVAIDASHFSFQLYWGGIYDEPWCSPGNLDHGVGCVGFGVEGVTPYWIVKNSWGSWWGESGYIRMIRKDNQCGIATMSSVPIVDQ